MPNQTEHFYKYRSLSGRSADFVERTLLHDELYFPRPAEFNDPFDCCPAASLDVSVDDWANYLNGLFKKYEPHLSRAERRHKVKTILSDPTRMVEYSTRANSQIANSIGILSLSAKPDHPLMWSHYADSHRGICLRFKVSVENPFFCRAQPVLYHEKRPSLNPGRDSPNLMAEKAALTKASFWSYEEEWRIIEHDAGPGVHKFSGQLLDGIILGSRISSTDREKVDNWIVQRSDKPINLLQAEIHQSKFRIVISR